MARRTLGPASQRFLTENLGLKDVNELLNHDPFGFLDGLVRAFRSRIPFSTLHFSTHLRRRGNPYLQTDPAEWSEAVLSGRGASCGVNNGFINDLLVEAGFDARKASGFPVAGNQDAIHVAIFVRAVERESDLVMVDVGSVLPVTRAIKVNLESNVSASIECHDLHSRYQLVSDKSLSHFVSDTSKQFVPQLVSAAKTLPTSPSPERHPWLIKFVANDPVLSMAIPQLSRIPAGAWFPYQLFADLRQPPSLGIGLNAQNIAYAELARRACVVTGYGGASGDYVIFKRDRRLRLPVKRRFGNYGDPFFEVAGKPEVRMAIDEEEHVASFNEEFPLLTDSFRDSLEYLKEVGDRETA